MCQPAGAGHRHRAALAEIVLQVDDDQRSHNIHPSPNGRGLPRAPATALAGLPARGPGNTPAMMLRRIARPMLSAAFIGQGVESLLNPKPAAEAAQPTVSRLRTLPDPVGSSIPSNAETFAQINAAVQIGGGVLLAAGRLPRLASAALALTVIPGNLGTHMFWSEPDPELKAQKRREFLTDLSLLGGLIIASADTAGKPSLAWRGRRAASRLSEAVSSTLPGSDDTVVGAELGELGDKIVHRLKAGAERGRELAETAAERGAPYAEAALERGRHLAGTAAAKGAPLAEAARARGEKLASKARLRGLELAETVRHQGSHLADTAREQVKAPGKRLQS
ncbi:DoxX family protein [Mycobacterium gastri 'Wayne']|nr:DoxX family protein [Mycobacterium gastri 'Wayne']